LRDFVDVFFKILFEIGICTCNEHFHGHDCGLDIREPPVIAELQALCDPTGQRCSDISVLGYGFVEALTFVCKITAFKVFVLGTKVKYVSWVLAKHISI